MKFYYLRDELLSDLQISERNKMFNMFITRRAVLSDEVLHLTESLGMFKSNIGEFTPLRASYLIENALSKSQMAELDAIIKVYELDLKTLNETIDSLSI